MTEMKPSEPGSEDKKCCAYFYDKNLCDCKPSSEGTKEGVKPCPYHGDPGAMEFSSASKEYAACMKCSADPISGVWYRPVESWNNAWAHKEIARLQAHAVNLAGALNLEKSQHEKAGVEFSKLSGELATKCLQLEERVDEEEKRSISWMEDRDNWIRRFEKLQKDKESLERQLEESNGFISALKQLLDGKQNALEHANVVSAETFEALKESQSEQIKLFDEIERLEQHLAQERGKYEQRKNIA